MVLYLNNIVSRFSKDDLFQVRLKLEEDKNTNSFQQ